jgi:hypothetical protein
MSSEKLDAAIKSIEAGDKTAAMQILASIVTTDPRNEMAWFWLSKCVEENDRKRYCLSKVLAINPNNRDARQALAQLEQPHPPPPKTISPILSTSTPSPINRSSVHRKSNVNWAFIIAIEIVTLFCLLSIALVTIIPGINLSQLSLPGIGVGICNDENYFKQTSAILGRWADVEKRAGSTARIALTSVVGDMQQIRRDFANLPHPNCANKFHQLVMDSMEHEIDAYLLFMQQASESRVSARFDLANFEMDQALEEMKRIRGMK